MKVLLVEDSERLRRITAGALRRFGHAVEEAATAAEGDARVRLGSFDVVVLDRMLPGGDGLAVLAKWRRDGIETPVLVLTALGQIADRVDGLSQGADDYLVKPFSLDELAARLTALCRRGVGAPTWRVVGPLRFDPAGGRVELDGRAIELSRREWVLLELLSRHPGRIHSRVEIEERLYADADSPLSNAVDAAVYKLRRQLQTARGSLVQTRRGLGYLLEWVPVVPEAS